MIENEEEEREERKERARKGDSKALKRIRKETNIEQGKRGIIHLENQYTLPSMSL